AFLNSTADPGRSVNPTLAVPGDVHTLRRLRAEEEIAWYTALLNQPALPFRVHLLGPIQSHLAALRKEEALSKGTTTLVLQELPRPRATTVLIRGNHKKPGDAVTPGVPAKLHPLKPGT